MVIVDVEESEREEGGNFLFLKRAIISLVWQMECVVVECMLCVWWGVGCDCVGMYARVHGLCVGLGSCILYLLYVDCVGCDCGVDCVVVGVAWWLDTTVKS